MAIVFNNTGRGYNAVSGDLSTDKGTVQNTYGVNYLLTSITVQVGTGKPAYGYYNYGGTVYGNGNPFYFSVTVNGRTTNIVTVDNIVGSLTQYGEPNASGIAPVYYYPNYSQCQDYTLTFSNPPILAAGTTYTVYINATQATSGNTCLVWKINSYGGVISGTATPAYSLSIADNTGTIKSTTQVNSNSSVQIKVPSSGDFSAPEGYYSPNEDGVAFSNKTYLVDSGYYPGTNLTITSSMIADTTSWATSSSNVVLAPLWYKDITVHNLDGSSSTVVGKKNTFAGYHVIFDSQSDISTGNWTFAGYRSDTTAAAPTTVGAALYTNTETYYQYTSTSDASEWWPIYKRTVTLTYDGNGASSGSVASQTAIQYYNPVANTLSSCSFKLNDNSFVNGNLVFRGWIIENATYQPEDTYTASPGANSSVNIVASASWNVYIRYYDNYSSAVLNFQYTPGAEAQLLNDTAFSREGYKLIGWNSASNGTGTKYLPGEIITMPAADMTLYAVWYQLFYWTSNDSSEIITGNPVNKALASKWNSLKNIVKTYVNTSFTYSNTSSNSKMVASDFNQVLEALDSSDTVSKDAVITSNKFITIRELVNSKAHYIK